MSDLRFWFALLLRNLILLLASLPLFCFTFSTQLFVGCVELGPNGVTEADLTPEERRQRMWWTKALANFRENFKAFGHYEYLKGLPENLEGLGPWAELPAHLK